jgi:tRNA G10  N-methylase Trm11
MTEYHKFLETKRHSIGNFVFEANFIPNEIVLTPFMGVGSEVFSPVSMGRKAIGIELKDSYFKQAKLNLIEATKRFKATVKQETLF